MPGSNKTTPLIAIGHFAEVEQASKDAQRLEDMGFHPVIRKPKHKPDVQTPDDTEPAHDLVMYVPESEARQAREALEMKIEELGDPHDEGYD